MLYAAGSSFALYSALTSGACLAIDAHASEELKNTYLPPMYEGRWAGAMCLTEAHSGTDLGLIRTRAEPQADGSYKVSRQQDLHHRWRAGPDREHHPPGAGQAAGRAGRPQGHLAVPGAQVKVNADGSLGARNAVHCGSIEHKMGIKASATCVMNFDGATGYLVGELTRAWPRCSP
jgi:Acyl-CoA dehydrogenases